MSNEKLLINDAISNKSEVISNNACVCLTCYKLKCKARSAENKFCPENGPLDWKGRKINEQRKTAD